MNPFVSCLGLVPRSVKPRQSGLTMVLDKFMGSNGTADLIETAGEERKAFEGATVRQAWSRSNVSAIAGWAGD